MSFSIFKRPHTNVPPPRTEPGQRVYAIGDIHGRIDLHATLLEMIIDDAGSSNADDLLLVYLGDYIDRGPDSDQMIEILSNSPPPGFRAHYLMGNHEEMFLQFIDGDRISRVWLGNGGDQTLYSYGCSNLGDPDRVHRQLIEKLPEKHLHFLRSLKSMVTEGDYVFVHAGLKPGVPLEEQSERDMRWTRGAFLKSDTHFGKFVVHGHSIQPEPDIRDNRIGIDTGAWRSDILTCLVLDGEERKFLST